MTIMTTHIIIHVPFNGETIITLDTPDGVYVPILPLCERFGVSRQGQQQKINAAPQRWSGKMFLLETGSGPREAMCLPLRKVAGWFATLNPNKVKPEAREALIRYQNEADNVLDHHFRLRQREIAEELQDAEADLAKLKALALSGNALWNRVARLQEAGCSILALPKVLKLSEKHTDTILDMMEDAGLIEGRNWTGNRRAREFMTPVKPVADLVDIALAMDA
jgi:hypothetical protein